MGYKVKEPCDFSHERFSVLSDFHCILLTQLFNMGFIPGKALVYTNTVC